MAKKLVYLLIALGINILLALIMYRYKPDLLPVGARGLGFVAGHALIYWLRPFLFVFLARMFYLLTNRRFTDPVAISVYAIAWTVMLVGMVYI